MTQPNVAATLADYFIAQALEGLDCLSTEITGSFALTLRL
jgi:hypothetical protein